MLHDNDYSLFGSRMAQSCQGDRQILSEYGACLGSCPTLKEQLPNWRSLLLHLGRITNWYSSPSFSLLNL